MKHLKPSTILNICGTLVLITLIALTGIRVHNANKARYNCSIQGTVENITPIISEQSFAKLEEAAAANSEKKFEQVLSGMYSTHSPAPKVVVTAKGDSVTKNVTTDSEGRFKIVGLPAEDYEISATASSSDSQNGSGQVATEKPKRIYFRGRNNATATVKLQIRGDFVMIKGHITDAQGQPIAGAKVSGEPYSISETTEATLPTRFAVSQPDGSYELSGFIPPNIYEIAGYLNAGGPTDNPYSVTVRAKADGFVQKGANTPKVPLVTEKLLNPARRLLKVLNTLEAGAKGSSQIGEKKGILLPPSEGNTITGVDITLAKRM